jgi:hypothetical protein
MARLLIEYRVDDFDDWKRIFDRDPLDRQGHGVRSHTIEHDPDDRTHFLLGMTFDSVDEARTFRDLAAFQQVWEISGAGHSWVVEPSEAYTYKTGELR